MKLKLYTVALIVLLCGFVVSCYDKEKGVGLTANFVLSGAKGGAPCLENENCNNIPPADGSDKAITITNVFSCLGFNDCLGKGLGFFGGVLPPNLIGTTSTTPTTLVGFVGNYTGFGSPPVLEAYSIAGANQSVTIPVTKFDPALFPTIPANSFWGAAVLAGSGPVQIKVVGIENGSSTFATADLTWNPGGHKEPIDIKVDFVVPWDIPTDSADPSGMSLVFLHFIKPGATYSNSGEAVDDCNFWTCEQGLSTKALNWGANPATATTSDNVSSGAIARLDQITPNDATGKVSIANYQIAWIAGTAGVAPNTGDFLLCADAFQIGTKAVSLSATVFLKGEKKTAVTRSTSTLSAIASGDVWFIGRITRAADGNLTWTPVDTVVPAGDCK